MMATLVRHVMRGLAPAGVPLAWRQLRYDRNRLIAATAGIALAATAILFQTGTYNALFDGVALQYGSLAEDLVIHSANFRDLVVHKMFSRSRLMAVRADPDVMTTEGVTSNIALWRLPTGGIDQVLVFGIDPSGTAFDNDEIRAERAWLALPDTVLWDRLSLPEFGDVAACLASGDRCPTEANSIRFHFRGTFEIGISFTANGQAVMSRDGFDRVFPDSIDIGY